MTSTPKRAIVKRRTDGLVLIRPRRVTDSSLLRDTAVLAALLALFTVFSVAFTAALVEAPFLMAVLGGCLAAGLWGARWARTGELAPVPAGDPPSRRVA